MVAVLMTDWLRCSASRSARRSSSWTVSCKEKGKSNKQSQTAAGERRGTGQKADLLQLLGKESDGLEAVDTLRLQPLLDALDVLVGRLRMREELASLEDAVVLQIEALEDVREGSLMVEMQSCQRQNSWKAGPETDLVLLHELDGRVRELPSALELARVSEDLESLALELETQADVGLVAFRGLDQERRRESGQTETRDAQSTSDLVRGHVVARRARLDHPPVERRLLGVVVKELQIGTGAWSACVTLASM